MNDIQLAIATKHNISVFISVLKFALKQLKDRKADLKEIKKQFGFVTENTLDKAITQVLELQEKALLCKKDCEDKINAPTAHNGEPK